MKQKLKELEKSYELPNFVSYPTLLNKNTTIKQLT